MEAASLRAQEAEARQRVEEAKKKLLDLCRDDGEAAWAKKERDEQL